MARNRKYRSAVVRFGPALKAFGLCLLIGGSGVGYVWQKNQIYELGKQIHQREGLLKGLAEQNKKLRTQLATMRLQGYLEKRIRDFNLGLAPPTASQVWYLPEPPRDTARREHEQQFAAQDRRAGR
jgi:hypothetical protein